MNFYHKMVEKLNEAGIDFGINQFYSVYIINGHSRLGKKYKPLLVKLVNHLCAVAEMRKSYRAEILDMRSSLDYNDNEAIFSVYLQNEEGDIVFDFKATKEGEHPHHWEMFKVFLMEFNRWLNTFE